MKTRCLAARLLAAVAPLPAPFRAETFTFRQVPEKLRRLAACLLLALPALSTPLHAQTLTFRQVLDRPSAKPELKIAYGSDALQFGELWLPKGAGPHPVVLLIHGGCWQAALPGTELMWHMADDLGRNGYAVWNIEYRRIGHAGGGYPGTFLDVAAAADKLRELAPKYHLDLQRVAAVGHSAGGHLALWAAARPNLLAGSPLRGAELLDGARPLNAAVPLPIRGVVGLAPIPDLQGFSRYGVACGAQETVDALIDAPKRGKPAAYADTSIFELLPLNRAAPVRQIVIHGAFDSIVPPFAGMQYRERAKAKGDTVEVKVIPEAGHFEVIAPWTDAWREVRTAIDAVMK